MLFLLLAFKVPLACKWRHVIHVRLVGLMMLDFKTGTDYFRGRGKVFAKWIYLSSSSESAFVSGICHWNLTAHWYIPLPLRWRHNGCYGVSNHQPHDCLLNRLFRRRSKKTSKLCVTGLSVGNSPGTGEFPAQMTSNAENVSIWWRHYVSGKCG